MRGYHRHPLAPALVAGLAGMIVALGALFLVGAIGYAYRDIGVGEDALVALLLLTLAGGAINIPVATLRTRPVVTVAEIVVFGVRYRLPVVTEPGATGLEPATSGVTVSRSLVRNPCKLVVSAS